MSAALMGLAMAAVFAAFVLGRSLAGAAFRVPRRLAPFGEAAPGAFDQARPGARLAVTLAGPVAAYLLLAGACTLGILLQSRSGDGALVAGVTAGGPADKAGLRQEDRIVTVGPTPVDRAAALRVALAAQPDGPVTLSIHRAGQLVHARVVPGGDHKIGVQLADPPRPRDALRHGTLMPLAWLAGVVRQPPPDEDEELSGPIAIVGASGHGAMPLRNRAGQAIMSVSQLVAAGSLPALLLGALLLWPPRRRRALPASPPSPSISPAELTGDAHPWQRLVARLVDGALVLWLLAPLSWLPLSGLARGGLTDLLLLVFVPLEALLLATAGYTPGKWLLRITVRDQDGRPPGFRMGLRRAALVRVYGLAASSVFGVATGLLARQRLKRAGATYWDALDGYVVRHARVSPLRVAAAVLVLATGAALLLLTVQHDLGRAQ